MNYNFWEYFGAYTFVVVIAVIVIAIAIFIGINVRKAKNSKVSFEKVDENAQGSETKN